MTEVLKGAAVGAVIGAADAGAKAAGLGDEVKVKAAASKLVKKAVKPKPLNSGKKTSANKKTGKGK